MNATLLHCNFFSDRGVSNNCKIGVWETCQQNPTVWQLAIKWPEKSNIAYNAVGKASGVYDGLIHVCITVYGLPKKQEGAFKYFNRGPICF